MFATFDQQDSGNISYGAWIDGQRYFVKTAGAVDADHPARVAWLRNAAAIARAVQHPALPVLHRVIESPAGPQLVYDWFEGELLGVPRPRRDDPASSYQRFRALPAHEITAALAEIYELHVALVRAGWIAGDFYDGCLMYDFTTRALRVIDLDNYHQGPYTNTMGRMYGSTRFMAPEEFTLGARIDERTTVFNLGRAALVFLDEQATPAQRTAANRACSAEPGDRFASVADFARAFTAEAPLPGSR